MIIYKDLVSGDEIISDSFPVKDVGDGLYEIDGKMTTIAAENIVLEGANKSAEEEEEALEDGPGGEQVLDLAHTFRWQRIAAPEKKTYITDVKKYMKAVLGHMNEKGKSEEEIKTFTTGAQTAIKKIIANYKDYDHYVGESMNFEAMSILVNFREDGVTPYATIWKHGLSEMKV